MVEEAENLRPIGDIKRQKLILTDSAFFELHDHFHTKQ